jgi:uncharacterized protein YfcZ (UPF0381/DUF406 family)
MNFGNDIPEPDADIELILSLGDDEVGQPCDAITERADAAPASITDITVHECRCVMVRFLEATSSSIFDGYSTLEFPVEKLVDAYRQRFYDAYCALVAVGIGLRDGGNLVSGKKLQILDSKRVAIEHEIAFVERWITTHKAERQTYTSAFRESVRTRDSEVVLYDIGSATFRYSLEECTNKISEITAAIEEQEAALATLQDQLAAVEVESLEVQRFLNFVDSRIQGVSRAYGDLIAPVLASYVFWQKLQQVLSVAMHFTDLSDSSQSTSPLLVSLSDSLLKLIGECYVALNNPDEQNCLLPYSGLNAQETREIFNAAFSDSGIGAVYCYFAAVCFGEQERRTRASTVSDIIVPDSTSLLSSSIQWPVLALEPRFLAMTVKEFAAYRQVVRVAEGRDGRRK